MKWNQVRWATKKAAGSTQNSGGRPGKRLGLKVGAGQFLNTGQIVLRQRGQRYHHAGINTFMSRDHNIHAASPGYMHFFSVYRSFKRPNFKTFVAIIPSPHHLPQAKEYFKVYESLLELNHRLRAVEGGIRPLSIAARRKLHREHPDSFEAKMHVAAEKGSPLNVYYELERRLDQMKIELVRSVRWTPEQKRAAAQERAERAARLEAAVKNEEERKKQAKSQRWNPNDVPASIYIRPSPQASIAST